MPFLNAKDAYEETTAIKSSLTDASLWALELSVRNAITTSISNGVYTVTLSVASATATDALTVKNKFRQLGYEVDDSTTPGSWIVSW